MLDLSIELSWFHFISVKSYLLASQCLCSCTFHKSSVTYTKTLETVKTFQRCCHPHPPLFPSHAVFHLPDFSYLCSLLGSWCPFFPRCLLAINNTQTKQQTPLTPTGSTLKYIMVLTGHSEQRLIRLLLLQMQEQIDYTVRDHWDYSCRWQLWHTI